MTVKHATASVFAFGRLPPDGWRLALIHHPKYRRWMLPGGHVEAHENPAEAALGELHEETGVTATLVAPAQASMPSGFDEAVVPMPYWIVEEHVPADREPTPHIHVDFLYVVLATASVPPAQPCPAVEQPPFAWPDVSGIERLEMFHGTRVLARELFSSIDALAGQRH